MKKRIIIPEGAIFTITTGCYSNYSVAGVFRAKARINASVLLAEWLLAHPEQKKDYQFRDREFLAWVSRNGLFEPVESYEWHLADYGNASEMTVETMSNDRRDHEVAGG